MTNIRRDIKVLVSSQVAVNEILTIQNIIIIRDIVNDEKNLSNLGSDITPQQLLHNIMLSSFFETTAGGILILESSVGSGIFIFINLINPTFRMEF